MRNKHRATSCQLRRARITATACSPSFPTATPSVALSPNADDLTDVLLSDHDLAEETQIPRSSWQKKAHGHHGAALGKGRQAGEIQTFRMAAMESQPANIPLDLRCGRNQRAGRRAP